MRIWAWHLTFGVVDHLPVSHVLEAKMSVHSSTPKDQLSPVPSGEGSASKLVGECSYCGKAILHKERLLPLECLQCKNLYHVRCLKGAKPPVFLGDSLYRFTCAFCGSLGRENWERPNLQWYGKGSNCHCCY